MKNSKTRLLIIAIILNVFICGCSKAQKASGGQNTSASGNVAFSGKNILIVYLSRTQNTKAVAEMIHQQVGGMLVRIELAIPYPENYQAQVAQVVRENNSGFLPPLKTKIDSIDKYDVVFVGFPTWDMKMPPPIKSFLKQYNLSGKTVIPFNTNAGYGVGSSFETVKEFCRNSIILEGYSVQGGIERDGVLFVMKGDKEAQVQTQIKSWLSKIGF